MDRIKENNQYHWFVAPFIKSAEQKRITNKKIKAMLDKSFPEQKGIPCPTWI
jgi:hypothetical protein